MWEEERSQVNVRPHPDPLPFSGEGTATVGLVSFDVVGNAVRVWLDEREKQEEDSPDATLHLRRLVSGGVPATVLDSLREEHFQEPCVGYFPGFAVLARGFLAEFYEFSLEPAIHPAPNANLSGTHAAR